MKSEPYTLDLAIRAGHQVGVFCLAHHGNNIQLSIVDCQGKSALISNYIVLFMNALD
jgi:hypothetical protein